MLIYCDRGHSQHHPKSELKGGVFGAPAEAPDRMDRILEAFLKAGVTSLLAPDDYGRDPVLAVHSPHYVSFLQDAWPLWQAEGRTGDILPLVWPLNRMRRDVDPSTIDGKIGQFSFDSGTPITKGTFDVAYKAAQCAASAAESISSAKTDHALCLTRPPGHHAMRDAYGGYCFFNNAAIAAQRLRGNGTTRVAILDVDYHHGNGTQDIFYDRSDVLVVNIHADPKEEYPYFLGHADETGVGEGLGFNHNLPLPKGTGWREYSKTLNLALEAIKAFNPDALVVSLGLDTGEHDPLGRFTLNADSFSGLGQAISELTLPRVTVLEGGYDRANIGQYLLAYLSIES